MERLEWVFSDADLVPLLVQENYANYAPDLVKNAPPHMVGATVRWSFTCQQAGAPCRPPEELSLRTRL
jgi:hypothetical protein